MLIRTLVVVALLATPLASSASDFDFTKLMDGTTKIVKALDTADTAFESRNRWKKWKKWWTKKKPTPRGQPKPAAAVPEPSAALLFGLGAVAVGTGIRRRR